MTTNRSMTRRRALGMLGAGTVALPFPLACSGLRAVRDPQPEDTPVHYATLATMARKIRTGEISSVALTKHMLDRISTVDRSLKSYQLVTAESALDEAAERDRETAKGRYRGPLHGIPIGIKDLLYTKGVPTLAGMKNLSGFLPAYDATVVEKLRGSGAVSLGKLALCEGAWAPYHPDFNVPVNPWDPKKWSGVSSSGSGVATAAGLCFGSIGTDTGGSIRYPSAANGCVGLKPTYGRVSRHGVFALAESMDHIGPMTRSVEDAAILFQAMAGFDPKDGTSLDLPVPDVTGTLKDGVKDLRLGLDRRYVTEGVDPEVTRAVLEAVKILENLGARLVDVKMPDNMNPPQVWYNIGAVEAFVANKSLYPSKADGFGPGFRSVLEYGRRVSGAQYAEAHRARNEVATRVNNVLSKVDCLICPSMSNPPRAASRDPRAQTAEEWARLNERDDYTKPYNFCGAPTLSVPSGFSKDGLPLSVQFVGSRLHEEKICRAGHAYEQATEWHRRHPDV